MQRTSRQWSEKRETEEIAKVNVDNDQVHQTLPGTKLSILPLMAKIGGKVNWLNVFTMAGLYLGGKPSILLIVLILALTGPNYEDKHYF